MMSKTNYNTQSFSNPDLLAVELANAIAKQLNLAIERKGQAIIALSGGSTPKAMLLELSQRTVDWSKVVVTLVDERCVDQSHKLSNAAMLSSCLLSHLPQPAIFIPLFQAGLDDKKLVQSVLSHYCDMTNSTPREPAKFDVVVLGMGDDGHTASFFPDAENIAQMVDAGSTDKLVTCESPSTQVPRITWDLPMLLDTRMLALHIVGENKHQVLQKALASDNALEMPIRAVIFQATAIRSDKPLEIYYAP